ncbi:hypothetical protein MSG28_008240 [Choristoneura fumiferana]|uniref:Uncharacterized protein n=1 Tax=Choristoneura fumiferana TaxID=7141 RepID=A0ACC0JAN7_CHOFU|nr:hypothetical protein MSG28_008240 [Choristoneura fumiferana]
MVAAMDTPHFPVQVDGKNYDIKKFLRDHPGGVNTLKHYEGKSILQAMEKFGHSISAYHMLNDFKVDSSDLKDCNLTGSVSENGRIITNEEGSRDKAEVAYLEELEGRLDWSKPILCQLDTIAPDYEKWVNSAVFRHCRIFSSPLLEAMTFTPWYLVPAFWIPIILYLGYTQFSEHVLSYLVYDMIHYYVHHGSPQDGTYLYTMKRYHSNHHFVNHDKDEEGPITSQLVTESLRCGREISRASARRGNDLVRSGVSLEYSTPAMLHLFSGKLPADAKAAAEVSHEILTATKLLQLKLCSTTNVTPNTFMSFLEHQVIRIHDPRYCKPVSVSCSSSKYRSIDGTCNNLARPGWGRKGAPFTRIAAPRYADGIYAMPVARSGRPLPNPRALSTRLFADQPIASYAMSSMNMQWGQFITHDLMFHAMETTDEGGIQCCLGNGADMLPPELQNDKCIPICVPDDDPFYRYYGIRCLTFVRSVTTPREDCRLGHAEQMNTVTSFLDGSHIYGTDPSAAKKLRTLSGGKLKEETRKHCQRGFLPTVDVKSDVCDLRNSSEPCYLAGDIRINQTPTLAMTHTILLREHNRIATILGSLNPMWSDEKIYQEARRIVIAELQHITYQEWLPLNFGENYFRYYRISPSSLYSRDYSDAVHPGVINSFGHAAFRYLHSMVTETIMSCPADYQTAFVHKLSDHYFNPSLLETYPTLSTT